ncbi:O-methyltransferase domain protein [Segniliparus rotundus DSM 44985]|uniref:O-methyltransferase domain protein n=1 Tax=Segniliparus rotundus (strain ATCC BAA-972 / CDC 1076 / CIP 108378 / DSM 44985 / JCM 13578) TaxID=640132 RepID=D6ZBC7_SEGRD|nr:class I SAM-dependent methyltransferase [Segniliparus rotundus]ADG98879.1 O-methyltransferase domain protein [Segniliparus rotundus DSM 44985]
MTEIELRGAAETAIWTLYTRAVEAQRPDSVLDDPTCVQVFEAIDYPYERTFGKDQSGIHGEKSRIFDTVVQGWLAENPRGTVVELGAGLETEFHRVDNGTVSWICVDLPEVIAVRNRFLPATERCRNVAADVRDLSWCDQIEAGPVLVTAQSLLMFLSEEQARELVVAIVKKFPGAEIVFDVISPTVSKRTIKGYDLTEHYRFPVLHWGVKKKDIAALVRQWHPDLRIVKTHSFGAVHGMQKAIKPLALRLPGLREILPNVIHVQSRADR